MHSLQQQKHHRLCVINCIYAFFYFCLGLFADSCLPSLSLSVVVVVVVIIIIIIVIK